MTITIIKEKTAINTGVSKSAKIIKDNYKQPINILDYGCGKLRNSKYLLNKGFQISILDTTNQISSLNESDLKLFKNTYIVDDINLNNINKHKVILCSFVLNVIPTENERLDVLNNIYSLLEDNGSLYLEVRTKNFIKTAKTKEVYNDGYVLGKGNVKTFQKGFDKTDLINLLNQTFFKIGEIKVSSSSLIVHCYK